MTTQVQLIGNTIANVAEVEAATHALRSTLRDLDYGSLGIYSEGANNGSTVMSAALAANSPIFSMRWTQASNLCLIRRVSFSAGAVLAFTAGSAIFNLFAARSWSVADSGGTAIVPTSNQNKLRTTGMGASLIAAGDMRISTTGTLTAGTRTKDANPLGSIICGVPAVAGQPISTFQQLFDQRPGEHPLILAQNEGIVLEATVPASGTWFFSVKVDWAEVASY